ncbi:MAG: ATP synthase subunit I [bacterium]
MAYGVLAYTVVLGAGSSVLFDPRFCFGVLVGGIFTYLNFSWLCTIVKKVLTGESGGLAFAASMVIKTLFAYGTVGVLIYFELVEAIPFIVGLTSLVVSVFVVGLRWHYILSQNRIR